jgi:SAM-dependent methyltransferase
MMDLGGGSGVLSMALLRTHPVLTSTVVDIENVCDAGREISEEEGLSDRIFYHPADFTTGQIPTGFDLILQCDVSIFGITLFQKLWQALKPGGRLILVEPLSSMEGYAPLTRVGWAFLDSLRDPHFIVPSLNQVRIQLTQAAFEVLPEHHALGRGWIVLQAYKGLTFDARAKEYKSDKNSRLR